MATIKINGIDFGRNVIAGTYSVNSEDEVFKWKDGDGHNREQLLRSRLVGSFDMFFKTMSEYNRFVNAIESSKRANSSTYSAAVLTDNISNVDKQSFFYFKFKPVRNRNASWSDVLERFSVSVEEY